MLNCQAESARFEPCLSGTGAQSYNLTTAATELKRLIRANDVVRTEHWSGKFVKAYSDRPVPDDATTVGYTNAGSPQRPIDMIENGFQYAYNYWEQVQGDGAQ
jgi:hypothetical protein